jgi:hypothetical protein
MSTPDDRAGPLDQGRDLADRVTLDGAGGERQNPDAGHVLTLDLKEALASLPLSEQHVKRSPPESPVHAAWKKLTHRSPEGARASSVKTENLSARASGIEMAIW